MELKSPLNAVKGIGEKREQRFNQKGIFTLRDLLFFFPRSFKDYSKKISITQSLEQTGLCPVTIITKPSLAYFKRGLSLVKCQVTDGETKATLQFFNMPFMARNIQKEDEVYLYGQSKQKDEKIVFTNPGFEKQTDAIEKYAFVPVYPPIPGIGSRMVMQTVATVLDALGELPDGLSEGFKREFELPDITPAYRALHFPEDMETHRRALKRFSIQELLVFLCMLKEQLPDKRQTAIKLSLTEAQECAFAKALAFSPTGAQARVMAEIAADLSSGYVMNRLVQGDVGCGKTAVAFFAMFMNYACGCQSVMMAPTEVLATQHYLGAKTLFEKLGARCVLITGSDTAAERRDKLAEIAEGNADLIFGTHALIYGDIQYKNLNLAITDEQHRFGVTQRAKLSFNGHLNMLVMSATPIPRTLALVIYAGMDVSVIDEMPKGRKPVETHVVRQTKRRDMYGFVKEKIAEGEQAYVVCPMIDGEGETKTVEETAAELEQDFGFSKIGVIHGRLKPDEKKRLMHAFNQKKIDVLVATTVIEVGVDVPNATVMVVENAERFGLATLHQLRGRVGRGTAKAYCFLVSEHQNARLEILKNETDGFKIAKEDLALRGPGQFLGFSQHGLTDFYMNKMVKDMATLNLAESILKRMQAGEFPAEYAYIKTKAKKVFIKLIKDIALN